MSKPFKLKGPYTTEIIVYITDGEREGKININLSMAEPPTQEDIDACLKKAEDAGKRVSLRLMNKREFFNAMMRERTGSHERFAVPGGDEWDS